MASRSRVMPGTPTSSTRNSISDWSGGGGAEVPNWDKGISSTRGGLSGVATGRTQVTQIQRKVTEKNLGNWLGMADGGATASDVAREQRFHSQQVDKLVTDMRTHTTEMRAKMANAKELYISISEQHESLEASMEEASADQSAVSMFREEMQGDFKLMEEKPIWDAAVSDFLDAALGGNKEVEVSTAALSEYLVTCLAKAKPDLTPSAAVVSIHPANKDMLKVFHADENAALKMGANVREVRENAASGVGGKVWAVLKTGEPDLNNAHGIPRDAGKTSLAPLKSTAGATFGVVVTGPPPVPDELLEMMCRQAGPLLEQVWKAERAKLAIANAIAFMKRYTIEQHILIYANFKEGERVARPEHDDTWGWQPLVHNPHRPDLFELGLTWKLGAPIGVVEVSCGNYTMMDSHLTVLLHVMADVLMAAIETIEGCVPGEETPLSTVVQVLDEFEKCRGQAPKIILRESKQQLQLFNAAGCFSELAHFEAKAVDDDMRGVLTGALCLMGVPKKKLGSWEACKKEFRNTKKCHDAMLELMNFDTGVAGGTAVPPKEMQRRWTEFNMSIKTKGGRMMLNKALYDRSPVSVQLIIRWVTVVRMEQKIEAAVIAENTPPPADPAADKLFDEIDTDKDGHLEIKELVEFLLDKFPSTVAHKTLRILDTDSDGKVSREEWRRGWADGLLADLIAKLVKKEGEEGGEEGEGKGEKSKKKGKKVKK